MESIMDLAKSEAMLFKFGSGTVTDLTPLRSSREKLSGGGRPSGPISLLQIYDRVAAIVKQGGKTRYTAKRHDGRHQDSPPPEAQWFQAAADRAAGRALDGAVGRVYGTQARRPTRTDNLVVGTAPAQ
jgi:hypothetical protein